MSTLTRRDFLKLASAFTVGTLAQGSLKYLKAESDRPNIIIILFDAMSAIHMSLYGYPR